MGRRTAAAVFGTFIAALGIVGPGASVAAAACPNDAFRTGPSAQLAECRAYEQVTPVDKESGVGFSEYGPAAAALTGDSIFFSSTTALPGAQGTSLFSPNVAHRSGDAWKNRAVSGPQANKLYFLINTAFAASENQELVLVVSEEAFAPGAIAGGSNLYLTNTLTGVSALVVANPSNDALKRDWVNVGSAPPIAAAAPDWRTLLIRSERVLAPGAVFGQPNIFEFREGRFSLAVAEARPAGSNESTPNVMSTDGERFFYFAGSTLYLHRTGTEPELVSEEVGQFFGATSDDGIAYFAKEGALYRYQESAPSGQKLTNLTPTDLEGRAPSVSSVRVSPDGTFVYFNAANRLTPDAAPIEEGGEPDAYVWHQEFGASGELRYIGDIEAFESAISPNGRYFGFSSLRGVYLYSYDSDALDCVFCGGDVSLSTMQLAGSRGREQVSSGYNYPLPRPVLDNGLILVDTTLALAPRDVNAVRDTYGWRDGAVQLISGGLSPAPSSFIDASADGSDVFFQTQQQLVGQDVDTSSDVYDARVDGGLPQGGAVVTQPCSSPTECRGEVAGAAPPPTLASSTEGRGAPCLALQTRAREAARRSRELGRRARKATGPRARHLRRNASRQGRLGKQLGRRAATCAGGGR